jgi:NAD(P)-dependent dehydrogenase (short-subunit alcohol dehydrogenase family)
MSEQRDLEGLSALVTGATSGIGRAAAEELGRRGAEVVVHGRNPARGSAVAGTITAEGGTARFVAADLSDPAELEDLAGHAGTVDVLVNNAGFSWFGPTAELDVATFDGCSRPTSGRRTSWTPRTCRRWPPGAAAASSTSPAWPARSAWPVAPPTAPPRPPWRQ